MLFPIGMFFGAALAAQPGVYDGEVAVRHMVILDYLDYYACVRDKAVGIALSDEASPPRAIAEAAAPACEKQWNSLAGLFLSGGFDRTPRNVESLEYFRQLAIGSVSSDIVEERAGSCGTSRGPYQCEGLGSPRR